MKSRSLEERWDVELAWVESLAFYCMFQPSASKDRFIMVATNALHQIRMVCDPTVRDELLGDPATPDDAQFFPSRVAKIKQLKTFARQWSSGKAFVQSLGQLDDHTYRAVTGDFRNRASHGIAPRFTVGITSAVTRTRRQATKLQEQANGTFEVVPVPGRLATSYGVGGRSPLGMEDARKANLAQFEHARRTFAAYVTLLTEAVAAVPGISP